MRSQMTGYLLSWNLQYNMCRHGGSVEGQAPNCESNRKNHQMVISALQKTEIK